MRADEGPRRIVSLVPAGTEFVCALGLGDRLVGVSHSCDFPASIRDLPRLTASRIPAGLAPGEIDEAVGRLTSDGEPVVALDAALLAFLRPDIIVTQSQCNLCAADVEVVRACAARLGHDAALVTLSATTFDGVFEDLRRVGAALGADDEALELELGLRQRLRSVHSALKAARAPRPTVAVIEWTAPLYAAGLWVPEMIRRAGGRAAFLADGLPSRSVSLDDLRTCDADVLLFALCGVSFADARREVARLLATAAFAWARSRPVWVIDGDALTARAGPRLVTGVETIARLLHPTVIGPPPATAIALRDAGLSTT